GRSGDRSTACSDRSAVQPSLGPSRARPAPGSGGPTARGRAPVPGLPQVGLRGYRVEWDTAPIPPRSRPRSMSPHSAPAAALPGPPARPAASPADARPSLVHRAFSTDRSPQGACSLCRRPPPLPNVDGMDALPALALLAALLLLFVPPLAAAPGRRRARP